MKPIVVIAGIIEQNGKILLVRRAPRENLPGKWEFPGGKLEAGETPEQCLERELYEELCISGATKEHVCDNLYEYANGSILLRGYWFDWRSGTISLSVHDQVLWLEPSALTSVELAPADVEIAITVANLLSNA